MSFRSNESGFLFCFVVGIFLFFNNNPAWGATFCIDNETDFQEALDAAATSDEDDVIKVVQGSYNGNFIYTSTEAFAVTIEGGYFVGCSGRVVDPVNTVLDALGNGAVLVLSAPNVAADFVVDGLTLQNGNVSDVPSVRGGGLFVFNNGGNTKISNAKVIGNSAAHYGGGIYVSGAGTIELINNIIIQNYTGENGWGAGLGIRTIASNSTIVMIENNISNNSGSGVWINGRASVSMSSNTIANNICSRFSCDGAGFSITAGNSVLIGNNQLCGNTAAHNGGGGQIYADANNPLISVTLFSNTICNNTAGTDVGGVFIGAGEEINIINNTIFDNSSGRRGGGIGLVINDQTTLNLINNTITRNITDENGGGIWYLTEADNPVSNFYNNIIWGNTAETGSDIFIRNDNDGNYIPAVVNFFNNNFDQSSTGIYLQIPFTIDPSNLNNIDPLFVDSTNGDYHLSEDSLCINAGDSSAPGIPATDKDGSPRIVGTAVDIGAFEYQGLIEPVAAFSAEPVYGIAPVAVEFTDQSSGSIDTWEWDFGDGTPLVFQQNPTHTYSEPGIYSVRLTVHGPIGTDTLTKDEFIIVISTGAPDLTGKTRAFHSMQFGKMVSAKVQVENLGSEKACGFDIELYKSHDGFSFGELLDKRTIRHCLRGGGHRNIGLRYFSDNSLSGYYLIYAVDLENSIYETDETNNLNVILVP